MATAVKEIAIDLLTMKTAERPAIETMTETDGRSEVAHGAKSGLERGGL